MKFYALMTKGRFGFSFLSRTEKELDERIYGAYWAWRGMQESGSKPTKDDYLSPYEKVVITVEPLTTGISSTKEKP